MQSALHAIGLSVKGYLVKPFDYHILLSLVRAWIEHAEILEERKQLEMEKKNLTGALRSADQHIEQLHRLLPVCPACHKFREDAAYRNEVEVYIQTQDAIDPLKGLCLSCISKMDP